ncbi:hypothetical protein [Niallia sp. Marseille-Q9988]
MDISITSKYDVFTECIFLLERRNLPEGDEFPKTIYDVIQKICEKYNIPFEEFSDEIYILAEVENFIMDNLEIEEKNYFSILALNHNRTIHLHGHYIIQYVNKLFLMIMIMRIPMNLI